LMFDVSWSLWIVFPVLMGLGWAYDMLRFTRWITRAD
jgi:hypothetical protein